MCSAILKATYSRKPYYHNTHTYIMHTQTSRISLHFLFLSKPKNDT